MAGDTYAAEPVVCCVKHVSSLCKYAKPAMKVEVKPQSEAPRNGSAIGIIVRSVDLESIPSQPGQHVRTKCLISEVQGD
jgi:hypothetical protein